MTFAEGTGPGCDSTTGKIAKTHQVRQAEGNQRNGKEVIDRVAAKAINTYWIKNIGLPSLR